MRLDLSEAAAILEKQGGVFIGQTEEVAPLDKRLYSLRDVTGTVESLGLITASILSKKVAEGVGSLVLDVKTGSGAFFADLAQAKKLAESLYRVGKALGLKVSCLLTDMNSPLGQTAGNSLEVFEALDCLQGRGPLDLEEITLALTAKLVKLSGSQEAESKIKSRLKKHLESGRAFEKFLEIVRVQGGQIDRFISQPQLAKYKTPVSAGGKPGQNLYIEKIDTRSLGLAIIELGGGRKKVDDKIDPVVGLSV